MRQKNSIGELWFPHDATAHEDPKIIRLKRHFGQAGYGTYLVLLEFLFLNREHKYSIMEMEEIIFQQQLDANIVEKIIEVGLLVKENGVIYSPMFKGVKNGTTT